MKPDQYLGIDDSHLVDLSGGHRLTKNTRDAMLLMQAAARSDGVDLSIASSYRDFTRQCSIWNDKWLGHRTVYDRQNQPVDMNRLNDIEKIHMILNWSALPGTSRHHWGTDLDVYDMVETNARNHTLALTPDEYASGGPCYKLHQWLQHNMSRFGFFQPYQQHSGGYAAEPWHLSYKQDAAKIYQAYDITALKSLLRQQNIKGLTTVIAHIDEIIERFVLATELSGK